VDETSDKERIRKKQSEINENLEKLIQQVKENDFEHKSLDKQKDVKKSIENTIIEIFSHNQKLQDLVEDMKKGFYLKNQQILYIY
jgi:peptidoglycan hydrolase CwlO-like protein